MAKRLEHGFMHLRLPGLLATGHLAGAGDLGAAFIAPEVAGVGGGGFFSLLLTSLCAHRHRRAGAFEATIPQARLLPAPQRLKRVELLRAGAKNTAPVRHPAIHEVAFRSLLPIDPPKGEAEHTNMLSPQFFCCVKKSFWTSPGPIERGACRRRCRRDVGPLDLVQGTQAAGSAGKDDPMISHASACLSHFSACSRWIGK